MTAIKPSVPRGTTSGTRISGIELPANRRWHGAASQRAHLVADEVPLRFAVPVAKEAVEHVSVRKRQGCTANLAQRSHRAHSRLSSSGGRPVARNAREVPSQVVWVVVRLRNAPA
jgi:hypothetical protein